MPIVKIKTFDGFFKKITVDNLDNLVLQGGDKVIDVKMEHDLFEANTTQLQAMVANEQNIPQMNWTTLLQDFPITATTPTMKVNKLKPKETKYTKDSKLSDIYKYPSLSKIESFKGKTPIKGGYTYIGVEIELEHVEISRAIPNIWNIVDDASLKVNGREFVSVPIKAEWLEVEVERLLGCLDFWKSTSRCSTHVHLNARDMTLSELKVFLIIYSMFERLLYRVSGDRWNNNFCVPVQFYQGYFKDFINSLELGFLPENWKKYHGLNLSPLFGGESTKIGTIEFRHMRGLTSVADLLNWVNTIISLKLACKKYSIEAITNLLLDMNTTSSYIEFTREVFGKEAEQFLSLDTYKEDIEFGVTNTKQVLITENVECEVDIELVN